ncbi:MerR family transcriptional regulator [Rhodococcus sp. D2-41]|uniref:transcriptional regulator FtsR n=1 Tax=Speluncibacter jeojiensis TaxID=2710754 RepID=UPI00240F3917|nr:MerR family transcriptional regulator [Rhodococcus sp. D2-41]MDG3012853.1 MerR family transcriptional regulator [Rhodococcus sp. D2-41]
MSIGSVLDRLRPEFPDITVSKIRFLESEGLVMPERTPSGYRRFSIADCERLRFVLTAQRDHYLPLKVIKDQLDAVDRGEGAPERSLRLPRALALAPGAADGREPDEFTTEGESRLSQADLVRRTGADDQFITELVQAGLLVPGAAGYFDENAVALVGAATSMAAFGLEVRHLRAFKAAADREAGMIAQIAAPIAKGRDAGARDRAQETVRELAALSVTLHSALVQSAVRRSLDG